MTPRNRRLKLDFEKLQARFTDSPTIRLVSWSGIPPEKYTIEYSLKGLYSDENGKIKERDTHVLEINLSLGYPRRAPQCKMVAPVFHPNFDDVSVCIGDFWAPSERLDDLVIRIGRMIAYQEFNIKSPLNGLAAKWADGNATLLPVDNREIEPNLSILPTNILDKIVVDISKEDSFIPAFESFFDEIITTESNSQEEIKIHFPRLDFGPIVVQISNNKCSIGRNLGNIVIIPQEMISAYHAEIIYDGNYYKLKDLDSTNGTFVNGNRLKNEIQLQHSDRLQFGNIEATFLMY